MYDDCIHMLMWYCGAGMSIFYVEGRCRIWISWQRRDRTKGAVISREGRRMFWARNYGWGEKSRKSASSRSCGSYFEHPSHSRY